MTPKTFTATSDTVDKAIDCASKLFRKHGYRKTTVDEIASSVRISKKTLYTLFPSKDVILDEATWRDMMSAMKAFGATIPESSRSDTILMSLCRFIFTDRIKRGADGLFWGIYSDDDDIRRSYREALRRVIANIYEDGRRNGVFKPVGTVIASVAVTAVITTAVEQFTAETEPVSMFNETLSIIADAVAYHNRIPFDKMG